VHDAVRERYSAVAANDSCGCDSKSGESCCGSSSQTSERFGYTFEELKMVPAGADLSLGCGNPTALASISPGETVVDLGSGAGIDCFLAAARVGDEGKVIGVDMTPEMVSRARRYASESGYENVEFRLGEIEHLPVPDRSADLVISNCVINLAPDKGRVLAEAFRILRPGGRMVISDIVLSGDLPEAALSNVTLLTGCISGALLETEFLRLAREAGFAPVTVEQRTPYAKLEHLQQMATEAGLTDQDAQAIADAALSVTISAHRPGCCG
jgi:ubiquinone/menaquinone biosynthesis C-methylase UbiE